MNKKQGFYLWLWLSLIMMAYSMVDVGYKNLTNEQYSGDSLFSDNEYYLSQGRYIMINQNCRRAVNTGCIYTVVLLDRDIFVYEHRYGLNCVFSSEVARKGVFKTYIGTITPEEYSIIIGELMQLIPSEYFNFFMFVDTLFVINYINRDALTSHACGYRITYIPIEGLLGNNIYKIHIHKYAYKRQWNNVLRIINKYLPEEYHLPLLKNKNE